MLVLVAVVVLSFPVMRGYARRVERSDGEDVDKLHRLRRGGLVFSFAWLLLMLGAGAELHAEKGPLRDVVDSIGKPLAVVIGVVVLLVAVLAPTVAMAMAVRPVQERLRGIEGTTRHVRRRLLRSLVVMLLPQALWFVLYFELLRHHANPIVLLAVLVLYVIFLATVTPGLVMAMLPTRAADEHARELVESLCDRLDVRIRGVRVIDTANNPNANALFAGFGFGPKYIFLTDKLLESFSDEEVTAVLAHEIGHRKKHHIGLKLLARLGSIAVLLGILVGLVVLRDDHVVARPVAAALMLLLLLLMVLTPLTMQGLVSVRLERQADDFAAATVGTDPLRRALVKLTELNMIKRRTGRFWSVMTQHPGMESRIERLEPSAPAERG